MMVCPLCWISRGDASADLFAGVESGDPATIGPPFIGAEKVIDF